MFFPDDVVHLTGLPLRRPTASTNCRGCLQGPTKARIVKDIVIPEQKMD